MFLPASFNTNTFRKSNISERHFAVGLNVFTKKGARISNIANCFNAMAYFGKIQSSNLKLK